MGLNETWKGFMLDTLGMWKENKLLLCTGESGSEQMLSSVSDRTIILSETSVGMFIISGSSMETNVTIYQSINGDLIALRDYCKTI